MREAKTVLVIVIFYFGEQQWAEIENFLADEDYATRWYTLSALDDIGESGGDVASELLGSLIPALLKFFDHSDAELEANRNVKYTATLREQAAGVMIWHLLPSKPSFHKAKTLILHGLDLMQIPEIKTVAREKRSYGKNPDR